VRGPEDAPLAIVYGDYECPFCAQLEVRLRALELRVAFRHFPVRGSHPRAQAAAYAAEAAAAQGAFWPMHDALLAHQDELRRREHLPRVAEDVAGADASGVAGTPTFFINGRRHQGAYDVTALTSAVDTARRRAAAVIEA